MSDLLSLISMAASQASDADVNGNMLINSPAFQCLDNLLKEGLLTLHQVDTYKARFKQLHNAVLSTCGVERQMLDTSKHLRHLHTSLTTRYKQTQHSTAALHTQLQHQQQSYQSLSNTLSSLALQRNQLAAMLDELQGSRSEQEALLLDRADRERKRVDASVYEMDVKRKEGEVEREKVGFALMKERKAEVEYEAKLSEMESRRIKVEREKNIKKSQLELIRNEPAKIQLNTDLLGKLEKEAEDELYKISKVNESVDHVLDGLVTGRKAVLGELDELSLTIENHRLNIAKRKSNIDEMVGEKQVEQMRKVSGLDAYQALCDERREMKAEHLAVTNEAADVAKQIEGMKKKYEKVRRKKETVLSLVKPLLTSIDEKRKQLDMMQHNIHKLQGEDSAVIVQNESLLVDFLQRETADSEMDNLLTMIGGEVRACEADIQQQLAVEGEVHKRLKSSITTRSSLATTVGRVAREAAQAKDKMGVSQMGVKDVSKKIGDAMRLLQSCGYKYEVLKGQRTQLQALVTEMDGQLNEMGERAKQFDNEMIVLKGEMGEKERHVSDATVRVKEQKTASEKARMEQNRLKIELRADMEAARNLQLQLQHQHDSLKQTESAMGQLRGQYAYSITNRNSVGLQLIDRNDELCLWYEQCEVMRGVLKRHEAEEAELLCSITSCQREMDELGRRIELARTHVPSLLQYQQLLQNKQKLSIDLADAQSAVEKLSNQLERPATPPSPTAISTSAADDAAGGSKAGMDGSAGGSSGAGGNNRAFMLPGEDPEPEVLARQIQELETRVAAKKAESLELELELKEVRNRIARLRVAVSEGRSGHVDKLQLVGAYKAELRGLQRSMMANVSELSMYQASIIGLERERGEAERVVGEMSERMEGGSAPTREAEQEYMKRVRDKTRVKEALVSLQRTKEDSELIEGVVRSTAEVRPNAYIQQDLGLPKPYGGLAPFKPSVLGAQMRHFRPPQPKEVQL